MNTNAKEALKKWREENPDYQVVRLDPIEKAKADPKSLRKAINAKCWDCSNNQREEIRLCTMKHCPLFNVRPYQDND